MICNPARRVGDLISDGVTEKQDKRGKNEIERLEFPAPLKPFSVARIRQAETYEQSGIGWIEHVRKAVVEGKRHDAELDGYAEYLRH